MSVSPEYPRADNGFVHTICRLCLNQCPVLVEMENGRPVRLIGDPNGALHRGFTCRRGRALPELYNDSGRLLHTVKRGDDGRFGEIPTAQAIAEVAQKLREIADRYGPRSIALYTGTQAFQNPPAYGLACSLLEELGSPMLFSTNTIDQPGKHVAAGLHGYWMAPAQAFQDPDVGMWIGLNPLVSYAGGTSGVPRDTMRLLHARGGKTIVIDPRRTETARLASLHLQIKPGEDVAVIAGLLHILIKENLIDAAFVAENVTGLEELAACVEPFNPGYVARRAGIEAADLMTAARWFGEAKRGFAVAGTGGSMSAAQGTLLEYLVLCLYAIGGRYLREGEEYLSAGPLAPRPDFRAQAWPPIAAYGFGEKMKSTGRADSLAGLQVADLPEEILFSGEGKVRALINLGGNPVVAWPDQNRTLEALDALELLVSFDVRMSQTAKRSTYVFASTMSLEVPAISSSSSATVGYANAYWGHLGPWAQYTPAVARPPAGSDVVEEWVVFYELARHLGLKLTWGAAPPFQNGPPRDAMPRPGVDMTRRPSHDEILEMWTSFARVPLSEVKTFPSGALFPPDVPVLVRAREPEWAGRLDVANKDMMGDLRDVAQEPLPARDEQEFRLLNRRGVQLNSSYNVAKVNRGRFFNPAFMNLDDMLMLGIKNADHVRISSPVGTITAVAVTDASVLRGTVSMQHCFGDAPPDDGDVSGVGSPVNRLISLASQRDPYSGQPVMANIKVRIERHAP